MLSNRYEIPLAHSGGRTGLCSEVNCTVAAADNPQRTLSSVKKAVYGWTIVILRVSLQDTLVVITKLIITYYAFR